MDLKTGIRAFFFWMINCGRSPGTCRRYRDTLENLPLQDRPLQEITAQDLLTHLKKFEHLSPGSRNNVKACLRSFFSWCVENDFLPKSPARLLVLEKVPQREMPHLSKGQIKKFLKATEGNSRDHFLFPLFLFTGCRLSEVQQLNVGNIRGKKQMRVLGKGRKSRMIPLSSQIQKLAKESLNGDPDDFPLFRSQRGGRLSKGQIQVAFKRYLRKVGIQGKFSVHSMRHTFGTLIYKKTRDLRLTQELLGHASPSTTCIYSHVADLDKKRAVEAILGIKRG
jgi:integrase/recombinase XerC